MKIFRRRNRRPRRSPLADPIAQAMQAGDRRSADVMWFGGVAFRMEGQR